MMRQFEVLTIHGGQRCLTVVDTTRWDFVLGFRRSLRWLDQEAWEHWLALHEEDHLNRCF